MLEPRGANFLTIGFAVVWLRETCAPAIEYLLDIEAAKAKPHLAEAVLNGDAQFPVSLVPGCPSRIAAGHPAHHVSVQMDVTGQQLAPVQLEAPSPIVGHHAAGLFHQ